MGPQFRELLVCSYTYVYRVYVLTYLCMCVCVHVLVRAFFFLHVRDSTPLQNASGVGVRAQYTPLLPVLEELLEEWDSC